MPSTKIGRLLATLVVAGSMSLVGCSQAPHATGTSTSRKEASASALAAMDAGKLREQARLALREQRVIAPGGDNAIEYYLALRGNPGDREASQSALLELQPYAVIGAEQALTKADFAEAERLRGLVAAIDPQAPSLARIARAISDGQAEQARQQLAQAQATADAAEKAAALVAPSPQEVPTQAPAVPANARATVPAPAPAAAPIVAAAPPPAPRPAAPAAAPPVAAPVAELSPIRYPQPNYPPERRRSGDVAQVLASFTVNPDGSISDIDARGVGNAPLAFERSVVAALHRWRYAPIAQARQVQLSFNFAP